MSIVEVGMALVQAVEGAQAKSHAARIKRTLAREALIPAGTQFGIGYRTSFAEAPTPTYAVPPARIDVATPVTVAPGAAVQGEQQQLYNYVTKPIFTPQQQTPAQIAQAEPTRMVMQAQGIRLPARRRAPVRRVLRKPTLIRRRPTRKPARRVVARRRR